MYATTIDCTNMETTLDEQDGTGECNPGLREETWKIFEEYRSRTEYGEGSSE